MLHEAKLASLTDLESIFKLMQRMQLDAPWSEPFDESVVRSNLSELLQNPVYGLIYFVPDANHAIAYLVICFDYSLEYRGKGAWVDELFVEPTHRQQGLGAHLLDLAESGSREHGAQYLHLEVSHANRAIELYRRRGFVDHNRYLMRFDLDRNSGSSRLRRYKTDSFRVQRSITIDASQGRVFSFVNDLHSWEAWSADNLGDATVPA